MDLFGDGMSIADMVAQVASEVCHSRVPPGFEWIEAYGQYYSRESGYYYDPNTCLFFHNDTQTYYVFNEETYQYEVYKCVQKLKWRGKRHEIRAKRVLGEEFERLDQEKVDVCEVVLGIIDKICKREHRARTKATMEGDDQEGRIRFLKRQLAKQRTKIKGSTIIHTDDPSFVCFEEPEEENENNSYSSDEFDSGSDSEAEEADERVKMMEDEGFSQPPCLRIIDDRKNLHVVTFSGGMVGSDPDSVVHMPEPGVPDRVFELCFIPESNSFALKKLSYLRLLLNDYEVDHNEDKEIEHGDVVTFERRKLVIHVHYGNNTCPGCEPGLLQGPVEAIVPKVVRGETARRRTMKMLKKAYGLNDYVEQKFAGEDRAALRRKYVGSEGPPIKKDRPGVVDPNNIYAGCSARPVPGATVPQKPSAATKPSSLGVENKGFKLLKGMGWKEGEGLGKDSGGRVEPVINKVKNNRAGLGVAAAAAAAMENKQKYNSKKEAIMDITKKRYEQIDAGNKK